MDLGGVEAIRAMKDRIEKGKRVGRPGSFNVKLGKGGIRDIEFIAQALCRWFTADAVRRFDSVRPRRRCKRSAESRSPGQRSSCEILLEGYRFLRRVENRIQMESERQQYRLPSTAAGTARRLARSLGCGGESS